MRSWRLTWIAAQLRDIRSFSRHRALLVHPSRFWIALAAKTFSNLWKPSIRFHLTNGGAFDVKEFMTLYVYREIFVDGCYDLPYLTRDDPDIIDVGANTGLFAIRMKQLYPKARICCYEPVAGNVEQLRRNMAASDIEDCRVFQEGVGGRPGAAKLFMHHRNLGGHSIYETVADSSKSTDIVLVDIPTALDRLQARSCDMLKLDCEGAEFDILKSLNSQLAERIDRIIFEPTPAIYDINELKQHLENLGYQVTWNNGIYVALRRDLSPRDESSPIAARADE